MQEKEPINLENLREICGNDESIMLAIFTSFINQTPALLQTLEEHGKNEEWIEVRRSAHKIKTSFFTLGAKKVGEILEKIEEISRSEKDVEKIKPLIQNAKTSSRFVFNKIEEMLIVMNQ